MILAGMFFSFLLAVLLSFVLSPAHISLVYGAKGEPLIRLVPYTDDPYWLSVVGFFGWFAVLGGFSLLVLNGLSYVFRRLDGDEPNPCGKSPNH